MRWIISVAFAMLLLSTVIANAAVKTSSLNSSITLTNACYLIFTSNLNFGSQGVLAGNIDSTAIILLYCTAGANYDIGMNPGSTSGGTTTTRKMTNGSETVDYQIFQNSARTINWGETVGTDTLSGVGTSSLEIYGIYGRVPAQTTPMAGIYTDTVTVTITF